MAVPASGELKLWDDLWNQELAGTKGENSLHSASVYAGFSTPDALSDFYGWSDVEVPTITTQTETSVGSSTFTANGCITNTGNGNVTRGFYMGTNSSNPGTGNPKYALPGTTTSTGAFSCNFTGLGCLTNFYYWAFGCNEAGETISCRQDVTTTAPPFTPTYRANALCSCYEGMNSGGGQPAGSANTHWLKHSYVNPYTSTRVDFINLSLQNDITACQAQCCLGCTEGDPKCIVTNTKNAFCGRARTNLSGPHYFCFDNYGTTYKACNSNSTNFSDCSAEITGGPSTGGIIQTFPHLWINTRSFSVSGQPYNCRINTSDIQHRVCFCAGNNISDIRLKTNINYL